MIKSKYLLYAFKYRDKKITLIGMKLIKSFLEVPFINIRNYGLGQIDNRNTAGTVGIEACGDPSNGVTTSYGVVASYGSVKQEAQSSKLV